MTKTIKSIGILGGMGPAASTNCVNTIVKLCQQRGAIQDEEFPQIMLNSLTLSGFSDVGIEDYQAVEDQLVKGIRQLDLLNPDCIIIPCNTVHYFSEKLKQTTETPILDLIDLVCKETAEGGYKKIGIVCSETTNNEQIYDQALNKYGIRLIKPTPAQQFVLNETIAYVMAGNEQEINLAQLKAIATDQLQAGAQALVLGCTELPIPYAKLAIPIPVIDSNQILAEAAVAFAYGS